MYTLKCPLGEARQFEYFNLERRMRKKTRLLIVSAVWLAAMLLAVVAPLGMPVRAAESTLNVAFSQEPNTLNAYYTQSAFATWATYLIQAHFFDYDENLAPSPKLAAEIPTLKNGGISKDGKTYTLKLKKDLKWSDGKPLTADDMAFTFEMIKDKANTISQFTAIQPFLDKITVVDPTTVTVTFTQPQPFPENVAGPGFIILPKHIYGPAYEKDKTLDNAEENNKPTVFSGAYMLKEWKVGESMTFVANPDYVMGKPKIENLVIKFFAEPEASYAALAAGQIDWIPNLQPADGQEIKKLTKDVTFFSLYGSYREYLVFNLHGMAKDDLATPGNAALQDVRVRKAIRLGIDREKLVKEALGGLASVSDDLYDQTQYKVKDVSFVKYDAAAAGKLLDEAGWKMGSDNIREKDGQKFELSYVSTTSGQRKANMAVIQQDLAKIGIKVNLDNKPAAEFFAPFPQNGILATGKFDLGEFANNTVTTNPANASVRALMTCMEMVTEKNQGGQNNGGYCNPDAKVDEMQITTEQSLDSAKATEAIAGIAKVFNDEVPFIILYNRDDIYAYSSTKFAATPKIGTGILNMWFDVQNWQLK